MGLQLLSVSVASGRKSGEHRCCSSLNSTCGIGMEGQRKTGGQRCVADRDTGSPVAGNAQRHAPAAASSQQPRGRQRRISSIGKRRERRAAGLLPRARGATHPLPALALVRLKVCGLSTRLRLCLNEHGDIMQRVAGGPGEHAVDRVRIGGRHQGQPRLLEHLRAMCGGWWAGRRAGGSAATSGCRSAVN